MSDHVLDEVHRFLGRFIAYPSSEAHIAHTLWIVHAHLMDEWYTTPRLAVLSAVLGSGKTRVLEMTNLLVPNPILTFNASPAAIVRSMTDPKQLPTILYDEIDALFGPRAKGDNEALRSLINAGYKKGATALKCNNENTKVERFPAYCALALAGIGNLPPTVLSRSIIIRMKKRTESEPVEQYRDRDHDPIGYALRDKLAEWATSQKGIIGQLRPVMPEGVTDRDAEVWEPLLAIADTVGGRWPERARVTAVTAVTTSQEGTPVQLGVRLLSDLKTLFGETDRLTTINIINNIIIIDSIWSSIKKGAPLDPSFLAYLLRDFGIYPKTIRVGKDTAKGYERADFLDAWGRHCLPGEASQPSQASQPSVVFDFSVPSPMSATSATGATAANDNDVPPMIEVTDRDGRKRLIRPF